MVYYKISSTFANQSTHTQKLTTRTVSNCISAATVNGDQYVGGIAGRLLSSRNENAKERCVIDNCYFTGTAAVAGGASSKNAVGARGPIEDFEGQSSGYTNGQILVTLLADDGNEGIKNATRMENYNNQTCDVKISGLTLNFTDKPDTISAGTPYLVRWQDDEREEVHLNFDGVIIKNKHQTITTDYANFVGSFSPVSLNAGDRSILYLGAEDKLYYPTGNITMGSCRAYLKLVGITAGDLETGTANAIVLNFGDDTTGITTLSTEPGKEVTSTTGWHTLDGRRVSGKPDKGIYIHNGKKVVVK